MKANVGGIDKVLRMVAGAVLLAMVFVIDGSARWWGLVGLVPLLTGYAGYCPLYALLGINSCPLEKKHA
jgi:DUF2892 family protein